jgi:hypothetical protein
MIPLCWMSGDAGARFNSVGYRRRTNETLREFANPGIGSAMESGMSFPNAEDWDLPLS